MSEVEQLEQVFSNLIQQIKDLENELDQKPATETEPTNDDSEPPAMVSLVMKTTHKALEMASIYEEFEMLIEDKIASTHIISNELMLNALYLLEQKEQLMEISKKASDIHTKWILPSEPVAAQLEALE